MKSKTGKNTARTTGKHASENQEAFYYDSVDSRLGPVTIILNEAGLLAGLAYSAKPESKSGVTLFQDKERCRKAAAQLAEYFEGRRTSFDIAIDLGHATPFQLKVWRALCDIPFGRTRSYMELAKRIGHPRACRAVGNAAGANPIPIIVPCHRLTASHGKLGGYSSGLDKKRFLLELEKKPIAATKGKGKI